MLNKKKEFDTESQISFDQKYANSRSYNLIFN
jgi:hypothetical protein